MYLNIYAICLKVCSIQLFGHKNACLRLILLVGVQGLKLSIYTYPAYHSSSDNRKITEKLFTQQVKS